MKEFLSPGNAVHRIKIDDQAGYIITTAGHGGVVVADLYEDEVLWSLPEARSDVDFYIGNQSKADLGVRSRLCTLRIRRRVLDF